MPKDRPPSESSQLRKTPPGDTGSGTGHQILQASQIPAILWTTDSELVFTGSFGRGLRDLGVEPGRVVGVSLKEYFDTDDDDFLPLTMHRRALAGESATYEMQFNDKIYQTHVEPLFDEAGEISGTIGVAIDITAYKDEESKLRERVEFSHLVTSISSRFINIPSDQIDREIQIALRRIGAFAGAELGHVFQLSDDEKRLLNTHEWVSRRSSNKLGAPDELDTKSQPWLMQRLVRLETVYVPFVKDLPDEARAEREALLAAGIAAAIAIPLAFNRQLRGMLGFYVWRKGEDLTDEAIALLQIAANVISNALERKRTESELLRTKQRLDDMIRTSPAVIYRCGSVPDFPTLFISDNVHKQFGHHPDQFYEDPFYWSKQVHPDDLPRIEKQLKRLERGTSVSYEYRFRHRDGHYRWLYDELAPTFDDNGNVNGCVGSWFDITDRVDAENARRQSEEQFRQLADLSPDGIMVHAFDEILYINRAGADMLGAETPEKLLGRGAMEFAHPDYMDMIRERQEKALRAERPVGFVRQQLVRQDGNLIDVEIGAMPLTYENRKAAQLVMRDISERVAYERALRDEQQKFRELAETTSAAIFIFQGEKNIYANPAAETISGYSLEEITAMNFWDLIHPDFRETVRKRGEARQRGEDVPPKYELKILTKSGKVRWLEYLGSQIQFEGQPAVLGTAFDITDRKTFEGLLQEKTEELQQERQTLKQKNVALKEILTHIEEERQDYKQRLCLEVEQEVLPQLHRLAEQDGGRLRNACLQLESNLRGILSRDLDVFKDPRLTPRELELCEFIRRGVSSKQISEELNLSVYTVHKHREQIRRKLGIANRKINLGTYLRSRRLSNT